jgi:anti-sigma-K factor RskA
MSDVRISSEDHDQLAAEYALGVLDGEELSQARALLRSDDGFRTEVGRWLGRFAPLLDEVGPIEPPAQLWGAIERRISRAMSANDNARVLERRVTTWRAVAGGASALAAGLAVVLLTRPVPEPPRPRPTVEAPAESPMVATLGDENQPGMLVASWDPASRNLVVAAAAEIPPDPAHSHELWVIPADGKPRSLGTMPAAARMHARLEPAMARQLQQGATLALSVEPPGGSPTGSPTGPVVASGKLERT